MKLVMIVMGLLFSASTFGLGHNEVFDFNSGMQPNGAKLGNVCYTQGALKVIDTGSTCVKWDKEVVDDTRYDINPRYTKTCAAWEKNGPKTIPMETYTCTEWKFNFEKWLRKSKCSNCTKCVKRESVPLKRTQRLDVYKVEIGGGHITSGQNMGSEMYTIPDCAADKGGDLPDTDVPDTKK